MSLPRRRDVWPWASTMTGVRRAITPAWVKLVRDEVGFPVGPARWPAAVHGKARTSGEPGLAPSACAHAGLTRVAPIVGVVPVDPGSCCVSDFALPSGGPVRV